jgi:hypothetical protein
MADAAVEHTKFRSKLTTGRERFLAHVTEHALEIELRAAADFIRHFPPAAIMQGLAGQPELRAQMLVLTTGVKHKIARRKSAESAGEDLQIALDEAETDAESIVAIFDPDDRIRYLDNKQLWAFATEGEFWKVGASNHSEIDRARGQVAYTIERALTDALITHRDVVEAIGVSELATRLPRTELGRLVERALEASHRKAPFTEVDLLATLPLAEIVRHVPLPHLWDALVVSRIAERHGFLEPAPQATPAEREKPAGPAPEVASSPASTGSAARAPVGARAPASVRGPLPEKGRTPKTAPTERDAVPSWPAAANGEKSVFDADDDGPIIESLPPDPDTGVEITDEDIHLT